MFAAEGAVGTHNICVHSLGPKILPAKDFITKSKSHQRHFRTSKAFFIYKALFNKTFIYFKTLESNPGNLSA